MKQVYPIVLTPADKGYVVYIPDFDTNTEGNDLSDAIAMARDAIEMLGCYFQDEKKTVPEPSDINNIQLENGELKTLVDVDFEKYRRRTNNKSVRKNCTIPAWLNDEAERAGVNFSSVLQEALKTQLGL
jgi:predicted RNase H-like HicB family nuclease